MRAKYILKMISSLSPGSHIQLSMFIQDSFDPKDKLTDRNNSIMILRNKFLKNLHEVFKERNTTEISLIDWNDKFFDDDENLKLLIDFIDKTELKKVHMSINCNLTSDQIEKLYVAVDKLSGKRKAEKLSQIEINISKPRPSAVKYVQELTELVSSFYSNPSTMYGRASSEVVKILDQQPKSSPVDLPQRPQTPPL